MCMCVSSCIHVTGLIRHHDMAYLGESADGNVNVDGCDGCLEIKRQFSMKSSPQSLWNQQRVLLFFIKNWMSLPSLG